MKKLIMASAFALAAVSAKAQVVTTFIGSDSGVVTGSVDVSAAKFYHPYDIVATKQGQIYITDQENNLIILVTGGKAYSRNGDLGGGFKDGGGVGNSKFILPAGLVADSAGTVYITDYGNNAIRKMGAFVSTGQSQMVTTFSGGGGNHVTGTPGDAGYLDGVGPAALFNSPTGAAISADNKTLYVADEENQVIRQIPLTGATAGTPSLVAGKPGEDGDNDGLAINGARFNTPKDIVADNGVLYVAEHFGGLRVIANDSVKTLLPPDSLGRLTAIAKIGNDLYLAQEGNILQYNILTKRLKLIAGPADPGQTGFADGTGTAARFNNITSITPSPDGKFLYVVDQGNNRVRKVTVTPTASIYSDLQPADHYELYPNPTRGQVVIESGRNSGPAVIRLQDLAGRTLVSEQATLRADASFMLNLEGQKPGLYLLSITAEGQTVTKRLVITE